MTSMTEVEAARKSLQDAQNATQEGRNIVREAETSLKLLMDAERLAWVALKDAEHRAGRETKPVDLSALPRVGHNYRMTKPYNLLEHIDKISQDALAKEPV